MFPNNFDKDHAVKIFIITAFIFGFTGGYFLHGTLGMAGEGSSGYYEKLSIFNNVLGYVRDSYVDEEKLDPEELIYGAIDGMLQTLDDPYTELMRPEGYQEMQTQTTQEFGGLGIYITIENEELTVIAPIDGTPAYEAGVMPGDVITHIEGESTEEITQTSEAVEKLRGEPGTNVEITVERPGETLDLTITRDTIPIESVRSRNITYEDRSVGYIQIANFGSQTGEEMREALEELHEDNFEGLILDMRGNPGGLLNSAYEVANIWIDEGDIVKTRGRSGQQNQEFGASAEGTEPDYPMMVLVDGGSASGSEIVAGALKDHGRAIVAGDTSFGKANVQSVFPLDDGSALKLTTARYFTPDDHKIHDQGIPPHLPVKQDYPDTEEREQINRLNSGDTVLNFVRENPDPSDEEIDQFIEKLREDGFTLDEEFIRFEIYRQQQAREGRRAVRSPATDPQLERALSLFHSSLDVQPWEVQSVLELLDSEQ